MAASRRFWHPVQWCALPRQLGLRAQLTLLYSGVFALLFLVVAGAYYLYLDHSLQANFDATLRARTTMIASGISFENGAMSIQDVTGALPRNVAPSSPSDTTARGATDGPGGATGTGASGAQTDLNYGTLVRMLNAQRQVVYVSPGFTSLRLPPPSGAAPLAGTPWLGSVTAQDATVVRVISVPLRDNGQIYGVLQVGEPLTALQTTLRTAALALFGVVPLLLLLGALGSYGLARRALQPVVRLTHAAQEIEAHDLQRRVPVPAARDEVQALALTLNGMLARLEQAFAQQRRFVADASHELRTPVAAIQSLTDVALQQPGNLDDTLEVLQVVNSEASRLGLLVGDLLALARADEGKVALERDAVRFDLLAEEVLGVLEPLASERQITVQTELQPTTVWGDDARLIQMLFNLVDNAIRYTPAGGQVSVSVAPRDGEVCLTVRDTGQGIAPEHLPHVFERFYRADAARTRGEGGSGLGLSIVEWVVRAHEGTIEVTSRVGEGTSFTVRLPDEGQTGTPRGWASRSTSSSSTSTAFTPSRLSGPQNAPARH